MVNDASVLLYVHGKNVFLFEWFDSGEGHM